MPRLKVKKREDFSQRYANHGVGEQAAIEAKYAKNSAAQTASFLLTIPKVAERIRELQDKASEKYGISMQTLVDEYKILGLTNSSDLMEYVDERILEHEETDDSPAVYRTVRRAYLKPHDQLTAVQLAAIQSIKETSTGGIEIKLHDKKGSLDSLTKILGGFVDKKEIKTESTVTHNVSPEIKSMLDDIYEDQ